MDHTDDDDQKDAMHVLEKRVRDERARGNWIFYCGGAVTVVLSFLLIGNLHQGANDAAEIERLRQLLFVDSLTMSQTQTERELHEIKARAFAYNCPSATVDPTADRNVYWLSSTTALVRDISAGNSNAAIAVADPFVSSSDGSWARSSQQGQSYTQWIYILPGKNDGVDDNMTAPHHQQLQRWLDSDGSGDRGDHIHSTTLWSPSRSCLLK